MDIRTCDQNDYRVWDLIGSGKTKGCFQIESYLGKSWCQKLKPRNIDELADLISLIRPGSLKAFVKGKSMTQHYADRKNGVDEIPSVHSLVDELLKETYGVIVYQEQAMKIAEKMAGFNLRQADDLRKAIGKKKADLMKEVRVAFEEGCTKNGISKEKTAEVFDVIEKSSRYSFNKSITPDTLVETHDGLISIEELKTGSLVKTPTGYSKVLNKFDHGELDVFEITLESGKTIKCTINHKFLCEDGVFPLYEILYKGKKILTESD